MRATMMVLLLIFWATPAGAGETPVVVAHAGGTPITDGDLMRLGAQRGDAVSVRVAIAEARLEAALAHEASTLLGAQVHGLSRRSAAHALLNHIHGPQTCSRIPARLLQEHYAETRWRFVAPPAWSVEDLQLLCCDSPKDCLRPEVAQCVENRGPEARALADRP